VMRFIWYLISAGFIIIIAIIIQKVMDILQLNLFTHLISRLWWWKNRNPEVDVAVACINAITSLLPGLGHCYWTTEPSAISAFRRNRLTGKTLSRYVRAWDCRYITPLPKQLNYW
jgi:hypothetical protein